MNAKTERHDIRDWLRAGTLRQIVLPPVISAFVATLAVLVVFGGWQPLVWQSFVVSLLYASSISVFARLVMPAVMRGIARRPGWPRLATPVVITATLLGAAAAGCLLAGVLALALRIELWPGFWTTYFRMARITAMLAVASGFIALFYEQLTSELRDTKTQLREKALQEERATKQALEARLSSLESRVQPHFLFNTLNSLSALIPVDPGRAEALVAQLATMLRSSLSLTNQRTIPLEQELALVRAYLSIEQQRLGPRLTWTIAAPPETAALLVPPFSVQGLVENAIKHGIATEEAGGRVDVSARRDATGLKVAVRDSGPGFNLSEIPAGHGLENLADRLQSTFGPTAGLTVTRHGTSCVVSVHVPVTPVTNDEVRVR